MRLSSKTWKILGGGLALATAAVVVVRTWVVPAIIAGQVQSRLVGKVTIRDWWLGFGSAGIIGLTIHEGPDADSPVMASIERVGTDLTLAGLLRGRVAPSKIDIERPDLVFRLDREGHFLNLPVLHKGGEGAPTRVPTVSAKEARVTFRREGRPAEMVVNGVSARLVPDSKGTALRVSAKSNDPTWGRWNASGQLDPLSGKGGDIRLSGQRVEADPRTLEKVPFVPPEVWEHVAPRGPVDVTVDLTWTTGPQPTFRTETEVTFLETEAEFSTLGFRASGTTGKLLVDDSLVTLEQVRGKAIGGQVTASGSLDFGRSPPSVDLDLGLDKVDVLATPKSWQLGEAGITGLLTGKVQLHALLDPSGIDLSGSSGEAVVEKGSVQGIPFKSLKLAMHAKGGDLQYDTKSPSSARRQRRSPSSVRRVSVPKPRKALEAGVRLVSTGLIVADTDPPKPESTPEPPLAPAADEAPKAAAPAPEPAPGPAPKPEPNATPPPSNEAPAQKAGLLGKGGIHLPQSISTQLELEDVDVAQIIAKVQFMLGFPFPIPVTGRLSLKADATIPLGTLRDIKRYAFHGDLTLNAASVDKVDFNTVSARLDLADGVVELKNLRGRLADRPNGGPDNPPEAHPKPLAADGPLPPNEFRGAVRAELAPLGKFTAELEGNQLPLGELAAPALPRPTPLSGLASLKIKARADLPSASDPNAWVVSGETDGSRITYQGATLDGVSLRFALEGGRFEVGRLEAQLQGHPLAAHFGIELKAPWPFTGAVDVSDWDLASLDALIPGAPKPSPIAGILSGHAEASGTAAPWAIQTLGQGQVARFQAGPVALGDVPFRWTTEGDVIVISGIDARPFGGRITASGRWPLHGGRPEGSATLKGIDTAQITTALPGEGLKLTGKADGQAAFALNDARTLEANVQVTAPDLTVQGIPAEEVLVSLKAREKALNYEVTAKSLGGRIKFLGDIPLSLAAPEGGGTPFSLANGELRYVGFALSQVWKALGISGAATLLDGLGAMNANVRQVFSGSESGLWASGIIELRDLGWVGHPALGHLRGIVVKSPVSWRVEPLTGELAGGTASGLLWGTTPAKGPKRVGFNLRIDRASFARAVAFLPSVGQRLNGFGTLRLAGSLDEAFRASGDLHMAEAKFAGVPLSELRLPVEMTVSPDSGAGIIHIRRMAARVAGGQVRGDATLKLGADRAFQSQFQLTGVDLQTLTRLDAESTRPSSGRINGRISLAGPNPSQLQHYRGKVSLDLDDASLFSIPVFREIEKFLGATRNGLFEDGDMVGTIANGQLIVEMLTLQGRIVQLHATGTIGFDTQLNLEVLINTNQIIPETGQALVGLIPGLRETLGRGGEASLRVANYLSNRLLKLRVTGTLKNPSVSVDSSILVADTAVSFFGGVLKLPLGFIK